MDLRFGRLTVLSSMYMVEQELAFLITSGESCKERSIHLKLRKENGGTVRLTEEAPGDICNNLALLCLCRPENIRRGSLEYI